VEKFPNLTLEKDNAKCPACSAAAHSFRVRVPGLSLFRCPQCRLVFAPINSDHGDHYHEARLIHEDREYETWNKLGFLSYWSNRLQARPGFRLLDVGCADGRLLELARLLGFSAFGVEPSRYYEAQWRARGIDARVSEVGQMSGSFDLIVAVQVIEHVRSPAVFIADCARLLTPGGSLLIETGDPDSMQARVSGRRWKYWVPAEGIGAHVSFMGRKTAATFGRWAGLELRASEPSFRSRPLAGYVRGRSWPRAVALYTLHRTSLSGGRCFWFQKQGQAER
jgi:2-polyprenyl-3-methyl-5-hydroxy-6-metoxy-1,4-benzoquinol methylase